MEISMKKGILVASFGTTFENARELNIDAIVNDVKNQYRKLQKVYHPDNQDVDREKILEINAAYSALKQYLK